MSTSAVNCPVLASYATSCQTKVAAQPALPLQPLLAQIETAAEPEPSVPLPAQPCVATFARKYAAKPLAKAACAVVPQLTPPAPALPPDALPALPLAPPAEVPALLPPALLPPLAPPAEAPALPPVSAPLAPAVAAPPPPELLLAPLDSPAAPPSSAPAAPAPESVPAVVFAPLAPPLPAPALALAPPLPAWPEEPAPDVPESPPELEQAAKQPATEARSNKLAESRVMVSGERCVAVCEGPMVRSAELNPKNQK